MVSSEYVTDAYLSGTLFSNRCRHNGATKKVVDKQVH